MIKCIINNKLTETSLAPGAVTLDLIREDLRLTGTKSGCREGECGACTVLLGELLEDGEMKYISCASCLLPIGEIKNKHIVTVEGLNSKNLTLVQQAVLDNNASQCGFCTPGIILSLTAFLLTSKKFSYDDAITALDGNICRCTGYVSIRNAAKYLAKIFSKKRVTSESRVEEMIQSSILPDYFRSIPEKLQNLKNDKRPDQLRQPKGNRTLIAGGTDLLVQKPGQLLECEPIFMSERNDLKNITLTGENIIIGAAVTVEEFRKSPIINKYFPTLKNDLLLISSTIMRNKATLAGNIVNASPIGDITIILLVLDTALSLSDGQSQRVVALKKFFKGYKKLDLKENEIIENIQIPLPPEKKVFNFEKISNRKYLDIASCNSAICLELKNEKIRKVQISAGGVAPIPLLLEKTSSFLEGKNISNETLKNAKNILLDEIKPIDDIRGTAKYKKLLLSQLLLAHFLKHFPDLANLEEQ